MDLPREQSGKEWGSAGLLCWLPAGKWSFCVSFPCRGCWMDVWELMSQECRDEVVLIDSSCLLETLETYLRKHRCVRGANHTFLGRNTCFYQNVEGVFLWNPRSQLGGGGRLPGWWDKNGETFFVFDDRKNVEISDEVVAACLNFLG